MNEDVDKFEQMKLGIYENLESVLEQVKDQPDQLEIVESLFDDVTDQFSSFIKSFSSQCVKAQQTSRF